MDGACSNYREQVGLALLVLFRATLCCPELRSKGPSFGYLAYRLTLVLTIFLYMYSSGPPDKPRDNRTNVFVE